MEKAQYDIIYLAACGVNGVSPSKDIVGIPEMEKLYRISCTHSLDALIGTNLKRMEISISANWKERISKAVRKVILFDAERTKLLSFMEQNGIWYLPLKGIILKDYYPAVGMRQMSDNDILFDYTFCDAVQQYMESQGYKADSVGFSNHDVYKKEPVYNFELHSALYGLAHQEGWAKYYENVKERLVLNRGSSYGYHFTDEDFYVYITSHAYKHYAGSGTGLRTLLDTYVYLKAKPELDFTYIEKECEVLGIAEFEKQNRILCSKIFGTASLKGQDALERMLTPKEQEMLGMYFSSGVYGTEDQRIKNSIQKIQKEQKYFPKLCYLWKRLFPGAGVYKYYLPAAKKYIWLLPLGWLKRMVSVIFDGKSKRVFGEVKKVRKV